MSDVEWADFGIKCPVCAAAVTTGDDWQAREGGLWVSSDRRREVECDDCGTMVRMPTIQVTVIDGPA